MRTIIFGGVIPVVLFTVIEETYGIVAGLIAGMIFGVSEIAFELWRYRKVEVMTWVGNGLILFLGSISLFLSEGIWFKLQPAIMETLFGLALLGSVIVGKPLLVLLAEKQGSLNQVPKEHHDKIRAGFGGLTLRMSFFLLVHACLATWAALYWSTRAWAILKGVGFTVSLVLYMVFEAFYLKRQLKPAARNHFDMR